MRYIIRNLYLLGIIILVSSCGNEEYPGDIKEADSEQSINVENPESSDYQNIGKNSVVIIEPDSSYLSIVRKESGSQEYNKILNDNRFYINEAKFLLKEKGIQEIPVDSRFLKFEMADGTKELIDSENLRSGWWIILFDGENEPVKFSPVEIYTVIGLFK